ncbi:putative KilA-N domain protein [Cotonvirus japonicus]|uniref:KilA-N domain protein n=1 Tax=Cotonvirus japonicus TaxID=2811091 RepID=A0ABM7NUM0_9VIRU|nr:putative KilA-N domain protein [Cotonvirus japonicus]BCS83771.1 putative KilA-N domain protein [Cotonvirus japonicus]
MSNKNLSETSDYEKSEGVSKNLSNKIVDNDNETDIKNIAIERINNEYYRGKYGDVEVIMDNNGYMNATKLCKEINTKNNNKKEFSQWKLTSNAKELMDEVSKITGIPTTQLLKTVTTSSKNLTEIRGTYAHPDLIPLIASWASPKFAVRVFKIVNEYFAKEMFDKHQNLIKKKDDKIDKLRNDIKLLLQKNDELMDQGNEVLGYAKDTNRKINVVVDERVPKSGKPKNEESFYIVKK